MTIANYVEVDGVFQQDVDYYSLRWVANADGKPEPVLYKGGKRVTKPWKVVVNAECEEDPCGASANTA